MSTTETTARFPRELLKKSQEERFAYFETYTANHPRLEEAFRHLQKLSKPFP
jgi:hypothetical protein